MKAYVACKWVENFQGETNGKKYAVSKISLTQSLGEKKWGLNLRYNYAVQIYEFSVSDLKASVHKSLQPEPTLFSNHCVISKSKWIAYVLSFLYVVGVYVLTKGKGALRH